MMRLEVVIFALLCCLVSGFLPEFTKVCHQKEIKFSITWQKRQRSFWIYVPQLLCNPEQLPEYVAKHSPLYDEIIKPFHAFNASVNTVAIPILLAFHGKDDNPTTELLKWKNHAEKHVFIVIAPAGMGKHTHSLSPSTQRDLITGRSTF